MRNQIDRLVLLVAIALLLALALVIWRGDQVGVQAIAFHPPPEANGISTRTWVEIQFDQPLAPLTGALNLTLQPPVVGAVSADGVSLRFAPATGLQPNTVYTVTLAAGVRSQAGHRLRQSLTWHFRTGALEVVYSTTDATGVEQLYLVSVPSQPPAQGVNPALPQQLTHEPTGIWDFAVAPDGSQIVYSSVSQAGTGGLWTVTPGRSAEPLLDCPDAVCRGAAWSPDGRFLAYSRNSVGEFSTGTVSPPRLWLLNPLTGENSAVFADNQRLGFEPRWSSDGQWLSYVSPDLVGVGIFNLYDGSAQFYETSTGESGVWRPQSSQLLMNVMRQLGQEYVVHLLLIEVTTNEQRNLSGEEALVNDGSPAWSPDGEWIAFRRKELTGPAATLGKQLWLMRADGSDARALTADPAFDHSPPLWSPEGRYLLFHKLPLKGPDITLSVWVIDTQTGQQWQIASPGQRPVWLP